MYAAAIIQLKMTHHMVSCRAATDSMLEATIIVQTVKMPNWQHCILYSLHGRRALCLVRKSDRRCGCCVVQEQEGNGPLDQQATRTKKAGAKFPFNGAPVTSSSD